MRRGAQARCSGDDTTVTLPAISDIRGRRVTVDALADIWFGDVYESAETWGEFRVER